MAPYSPPVDDIGFLLGRVFDFDALVGTLPGHEDLGTELAVSVLEEGGKFCAGVLEPLNRPADEEGCRLVDGLVSTPKGMAEAYRAFVAAGWPALSGDPEYGGQGLPQVMQILFDEMIASTNLSFGLFPGLTRGAVEAISHHGSAELKAIYLPKMTSGAWTGAMALTEAAAGTDLGLLTARAEPGEDGSFRIRGTKIFISSGDHDFGGNIIHLVLARLPDAPSGVRGISLFLVPKFLVNQDGTLGARNTMSVGSLEHKMGIHAQPTCVMNYDGATGWLIGEPGRGLNAMFTMMNAERLLVGIQGLGIAEAATQKAAAYARERLQTLVRLERATQRLLAERTGATAGASDYLRLFALVAFGWMWARMAAAATDGALPLHRRKRASAAFFAERILPQTLGLEQAAGAGAASLMALNADMF